MKKCCYSPDNLMVYGSRGKKIEAFNGVLIIHYTAYMRCKVCNSLLTAQVQKSIHDREPAKKAP